MPQDSELSKKKKKKKKIKKKVRKKFLLGSVSVLGLLNGALFMDNNFETRKKVLILLRFF